MNQLDSDLKRLLKWARAAAPPEPVEAPFGFAGRVSASGARIATPTLLQELQRAAWALTGLSLLLIAGGSVVLASLPSAPAPAAELPSALSFLASNLAP